MSAATWLREKRSPEGCRAEAWASGVTLAQIPFRNHLKVESRREHSAAAWLTLLVEVEHATKHKDNILSCR